jgi:hypothetical protein
MIWLLTKMMISVVIIYYVLCLCWPILVLALVIQLIRVLGYASQTTRCDCDARVADPTCSCCKENSTTSR